ncbi:malonyl-ACP O-methyltransferase BioC [Enterovibrio norvegicus]|uniref:malonyl-ACP O-methyltransferase BioC n=1 Tax=Enterovibrio norvegicus TaxID=188144 RepID=UPI000316193D|nr:malonyl-ACP O-methyltransferase BioC [Enterovibrio norvegicus]OEE68669.1 malonyl-[acyl-carrier protein] O-methyltransferase BioC [Enterovibrio norvegicus]
MSNAASLGSLFDEELNAQQHDDKAAIKAAFGRAANSYDKSAAFQRRVGHELMAMHHDWKGRHILDLGCGTGYFSAQLAGKGASVIALDLSDRMLEKARDRCGDSLTYVSGDAEALPLASNSVDMAFSSLALQWCKDLSVPLSELKRVVKPGGTILFSTLLDGSLLELKKAWEVVDSEQHVNAFVDIKAVNIALAQAGFTGYTLECKAIAESYPSAFALMKDLKGIGATHLDEGRKAGLNGRKALLTVESAYRQFQRADGTVPATYQVCFGAITND